MALSPQERSERARIAAFTRWAKEPDRTTATAAARRGLDNAYRRQVDPDGALTEPEVAVRVKALRTAQALRAAQASRRARAARKTAPKAGVEAARRALGGEGVAS